MFIKTKVRGLEGERKNDLGSYNSRRFNFKGTGVGGGGGGEGEVNYLNFTKKINK